jgi:tetraacyldisaccharide 4'-kinase
MTGKLRQKIESAMADNNRYGFDPFYMMLAGASKIYEKGVAIRTVCFEKGIMGAERLPCPVISIGNITAGGTGKTPMALYTAGLIRQMGYRPAVVSRGYRGQAEKSGAVVSDGFHLFADCRTAGDEPFMMACRLKGVPVLVGRNRFQSAMRAVVDFESDVIILDDGFQHRRLHRDLDLVLMDAANPVGNGYLIPRGPLREPVSGLKRAHAIIFTRSKNALGNMPKLAFGIGGNSAVFYTNHIAYIAGFYETSGGWKSGSQIEEGAADLNFLAKARVFIFSGIARNNEFYKMVKEHAGDIAGIAQFPDHYCYSPGDLKEIEKKAISRSADVIVTSEKDYVKIAGRMPGKITLAVIGVKIRFCDDDEAGFIDLLRAKLLPVRNDNDF